MTETRKAQLERYYRKLRNDPVRWSKRMERQRKRRSDPSIREKELADERTRWNALPKDSPRKRKHVGYRQRIKAKNNRAWRNLKKREKAKRKQAEAVLPDYKICCNHLGMRMSECPKDLIMLKREHLKLNRLLGKRLRAI